MRLFYCKYNYINGLTKGRDYDMLNCEGDYVLITDDFGEDNWYPGCLFTSVNKLAKAPVVVIKRHKKSNIIRRIRRK